MKNKPSFRHHFDTLSDKELDDLAEVHEDYPPTVGDLDNMVNTIMNKGRELAQELGYEPYLDTFKKPTENSDES
mgnify:CR=1 FL=1